MGLRLMLQRLYRFSTAPTQHLHRRSHKWYSSQWLLSRFHGIEFRKWSEHARRWWVQQLLPFSWRHHYCSLLPRQNEPISLNFTKYLYAMSPIMPTNAVSTARTSSRLTDGFDCHTLCYLPRCDNGINENRLEIQLAIHFYLYILVEYHRFDRSVPKVREILTTTKLTWDQRIISDYKYNEKN